MIEEKIPRRYAVPPYLVGFLDGDVPVFNFPGSFWQMLGRHYIPTQEEVRELLIGVRERLNWSRSTLAFFLGTKETTLRRWEDGTRTPSGAARRLIWLVGTLILQPERLQDGLAGWAFWGEGARLREVSQKYAPEGFSVLGH